MDIASARRRLGCWSWMWSMLFLASYVALNFNRVSASSPDFSIKLTSLDCEDGDSMDIQCTGDARNLDKAGITLINFDQGSKGYVFLKKSIKMVDVHARQVASFNTTFTFSMVMSDNCCPGDGLSFIMFGNRSYEGFPGGSMGVYDETGRQGTPTFSVEFDTWSNGERIFNDTSYNHVGVDVGNVTSRITRDASDVNIPLNGGQLVTTWIEYDAPTANLEIRISNGSRPNDPFISYNVDLFAVLVEEMAVGIGASAGGNAQSHNVISWGFSSFGLQDKSPSIGKHLIIGISTGACFLLILVFGYGLRKFLRRKRERALDREFVLQLPLEDMPQRFSYKELSIATKRFSKKSQLGVGGSSSVFGGKIVSSETRKETLVAVKKVNIAENRTEGEKLFAAEVSVISRLRHKNLVKLLGWCRDRGNYLLVYELMPKGSLDKLLHEKSDEDGNPRSALPWTQRLAIIRGVAAALTNLHEGYNQQVIHRDVKSSNVMLDQDFNPKVGDFGLARLIEHKANVETMHVAGTRGYIAPEATFGVFNDKTDVYAFGTLALEIACGRQATDSGVLLVDWVWNLYSEGKILRAADRRILTVIENDVESGDHPKGALANDVARVQLIGLLCCHPNSEDRPSMRDVELFLDGRLPVPPVPSIKPVFRYFNDATIDVQSDVEQDDKSAGDIRPLL